MLQIQLLLLHLYFLVGATVAATVPASIDVELTTSQLFTVGSQGTAGRCTADELATLDGFVGEARVLHNALLKAYQDWTTDKAYRLMFFLYLGIRFNEQGTSSTVASTAQWAVVETRLAQVAQFLSGGGLVNARSDESPSIFCNDEFAEEVEYAWQQIANDATGAEMITGQDRRGRQTGITIEQVYPHIQVMAPSSLPWWCPELGGYTFSTGLIDSLCAKEGRQALTSRADAYPSTEAGSSLGFTYASFNRHVLLCPASFTPAEADAHSQPSVAGLVTSGNYPARNDNRLIDMFGTVSCTLYHEVFHLVDSAGTDRDGPDERDADGNLIKYNTAFKIISANMQGAAQIVNAPEPYVLMALAAYMYQNPPSGSTGLFFVPNVGWTDTI